MYQLLRGRSLKAIFTDALPPLALAFIIAELFFKWGSFTLECAGFLVVWFVLDWRGRDCSPGGPRRRLPPPAEAGCYLLGT